MQNPQESDAMTPQRGGAREGAGRPKGSTGEVRKPVSFTLLPAEKEALEVQAAAVGLSASMYISAVIALGDVIVPLVRRGKQTGDD